MRQEIKKVEQERTNKLRKRSEALQAIKRNVENIVGLDLNS